MAKPLDAVPKWGCVVTSVWLGLAISLAVVGCQGESGEGNPGAVEENRLEIPVTVQGVELSDFATYIDITAILKAKKSVWVLAETSGEIERVVVSEGDAVTAGQFIAQVEDEEAQYALQETEAAYALSNANYDKLSRLSRPQEVEAQRAAVESAASELRTAELDLRRVERLYHEGILPKERYDAARARHQAAKSAHHAAREQLSLLEEGAREEDIRIAKAQAEQAWARLLMARKRLEDTRIKSPITGRVVKLPVVAGDRIGVGSQIAEVIDVATLEAEVGLTQEEISFVLEGESVSFETDAFPGHAFQGIIVYAGLKASERSGVFPVTIRVKNGDELLRPGMIATFRLPKQRFRQVVVIPRDAVVDRADGRVVFVVDGDKAREKSVVLGATQGDRTIVEEGLDAGEVVVVVGQHSLQGGAWIRVEKTVSAPHQAVSQLSTEG